MKVTLIRPSELQQEHLRLWNDYRGCDGALQNPFFCPEYVQAIGAVRRDVRVAVIEMDNRAIGFFPFQRTRWNVAHAVGRRLCDLAGIVCSPDWKWSARDLVKSCGLSGWVFRNALASLPPLRPYGQVRFEAPYIDLSGGFQAFESERLRAGSALVQEVARKFRKMQREIGPARFVFHTTDADVFAQLRKWKSEQRRRTGTVDVLAMNWVVEALERIRSTQSGHFAGVMSVLYAGDRIAAVHLGMRSATVLHYWFPAYNFAFEKYSPGSLLLMEIARAAPAYGVERIDLGEGGNLYKSRFKSAAIELCNGTVDCTWSRRVFSAVWCKTRDWSRTSSFRSVILSAKRFAERAYYRASN